MEEENIPIKPKRVRKNPTRKWSAKEENDLVDFLMDNLDVERPTAQLYYRRFALEKGVDIEWNLVRSKVRNMRVSYNKAKAWETSTGAGSMDGDTVKNTLLKMCSFYDEFDEIFGSRIIETGIIEETLESNNNITEIYDITEIESNETSNIPEGMPIDCEMLPSTSRKGIYSRTAVSDIMQIQSEMVAIKKEKMDQEREIKEREMDQEREIKKRELDIKEREVVIKEKEMTLKEKEINSNEKLKILELEMKERLAMEELKYKYK